MKCLDFWLKNDSLKSLQGQIQFLPEVTNSLAHGGILIKKFGVYVHMMIETLSQTFHLHGSFHKLRKHIGVGRWSEKDLF